MFNKILCSVVMLTPFLFGKVKNYGFEPVKNPKLFAGFDSLNTRFIGNWPFGPSHAVSFDAQRNLVFCGSKNINLDVKGIGNGIYFLKVENKGFKEKIKVIVTQ